MLTREYCLIIPCHVEKAHLHRKEQFENSNKTKVRQRPDKHI